ncbi:hypothetical protein Cgig2_025344 [Carnegiea gigantea]|uniref:Uncharacterized protein n=1 Tax=Carnegiea gigantea TaxID=171969 RepID=A0A9Q1Q605_9CARY|nr:hypothetical protein Cgig2_025344 [Carnegiea gigantea]
MRRVSPAFAIIICSPTIKRHDLFVTQVIFVGDWWDEIHQLRISSLDLGLTAILHVLNIRFKIAFLAKSFRRQDHQQFSKELHAVFKSMLIALLLSLVCFFSSCHSLSLRFRTALFQMALQASFSFFIFSRRCLYLATDSFDFLHSAWRLRIRFSEAEIDETNSTITGSRRRIGPTSARATYSSVTFSGSASQQEPEPRISLKIHGLGLTVHQELLDSPQCSPLVFLGAARSRRSQCNAEGQVLSKLSLVGRPFSPFTPGRRVLSPKGDRHGCRGHIVTLICA